MRFEKGSPIRGFSLGATAGTLAGHLADLPGQRHSKNQGYFFYIADHVLYMNMNKIYMYIYIYMSMYIYIYID